MTFPISFTSKKNVSRQPGDGSKEIDLRIFLIGLCVLVLWLPLADMAFHFLPEPENTEKRILVQAPEFRWETIPNFPKTFEGYFNDRFGGRKLLIPLNNYIRVQWFKVSPIKSVLVGKEGWLFFTLDKGINDYRGLASFSPEHLEAIRRNILKWTSWLQERGIPFFILIAPNKHTIYPEYLPGGLTRVRQKTRLDQILEYLTEEEKAGFIDVRKELDDGKKERFVYSKTDTHWNSYGAFIAYRKTMEALSRRFPQALPPAVSGFSFSVKPSQGLGDLAVMLSLKGHLQDQEVSLELESDSALPPQKIFKAVILHDSFIFSIKPFLRYHFDQMVLQPWGKKGFDYLLIEKEKPQVVLFEVTERFLDVLLK
jgi:hypothetical protein